MLAKDPAFNPYLNMPERQYDPEFESYSVAPVEYIPPRYETFQESRNRSKMKTRPPERPPEFYQPKSGLMDISNVSKSATSMFVNSNIADARLTVERKDDKHDYRPRREVSHFDEITRVNQSAGRRIIEEWDF